MRNDCEAMLFYGLLYFVVQCLGVSTAFADTSADAILVATGVQGGLVVHVGCGDGTRTARFHGSDRTIVHGLDTRNRSGGRPIPYPLAGFVRPRDG